MTVCTRCAWLYKALLKRWQINVMFEYVWNIWELATQMPRRQMVTGGHQRNTHKNGHHKSPETYLAAGEWILHCNENLVKNYEHVQCSHVFPHHFAGASGSPAATKDIAGAWQAAPVQTSALYQALKGFRWASEQEETSQWLPSGCHMLPPFVQIVQMVHKSKNWNRKHCKFSNHRDLWNSMCPSTEGILRGHFRSQRSCSWCSVGSTIFNARCHGGGNMMFLFDLSCFGICSMGSLAHLLSDSIFLIGIPGSIHWSSSSLHGSGPHLMFTLELHCFVCRACEALSDLLSDPVLSVSIPHSFHGWTRTLNRPLSQVMLLLKVLGFLKCRGNSLHHPSWNSWKSRGRRSIGRSRWRRFSAVRLEGRGEGQAAGACLRYAETERSSNRS